MEKSLARRACSRCGRVFSMRSVSLPATAERQALHLPAVLPSPGCLPHLTTRADDTPAAVLRRLQVRTLCHTLDVRRCVQTGMLHARRARGCQLCLP